ncbi:hypothetical protein [Nocardiopsis ganjiahuensis]|uniref:hypothetical protein n=1 Tax=Nocardiopsis ganjiahuensis TaxID=239984 RepID=UPI000349A3AE|nr:hypothetical protein [Nocardiopsis ganjiahuensis]
MSLITVAGMLGGLAMVLLARRGRRIAEQLLADERAGLVGPREAALGRIQQKERSLSLGRGICVFVAALLVAVLGRAAVSGDWGGTTVYYAALFAILLVVSALTLRKVSRDLTEARAQLDRR